MDLTNWKPINGCSRLSPHTEEDWQAQNDALNTDHCDPERAFKTDWEVMWPVIKVMNHL